MSTIRRLIGRTIRSQLKSRGYHLVGNPSLHGAAEHFGAIMFSRKLAQLDFFYNLIRDVDGDVVESGIWWGYGLLAHLRLVRAGTKTRSIIGFDSFQGHSKPHAKDFVGGHFANPGTAFAVSEADVWKTLTMGTEDSIEQLRRWVTIIPGWLQETMPAFIARNPDRRIALIHCDPDLYEPIFLTLSTLWANLAPGGVIILGRLNNPEFMGKTAAVTDFRAAVSEAECLLESFDIHELETNRRLDLHYLRKAIP
jgi:hypothetical protein